MLINDYGNLPIKDDITHQSDINSTSSVKDDDDKAGSMAAIYPTLKNYKDFLKCNRDLIKRIPELLQENDSYLILGGDHAIGFGKYLLSKLIIYQVPC